MTDDDIKRETTAEHYAAPARDVVDLGHRPHLAANAALGARIEAPVAFEQPVAHAKPPSLAEGGTPVAGSTLSEEELDRIKARFERLA